VDVSETELFLLRAASLNGQLILPAFHADNPDLLGLIARGLLAERSHEHGDHVRAFVLTASGSQALLSQGGRSPD
jgi:hypothetical protein